MTVSVLFLVGRFLFAVPFVMRGVDGLFSDAATPARRMWSALGLVGAAGVVLGVHGDVSAFALAVVVVGVGITAGQGPDTTDATRLRLVGLLGGALCVAALYIAVGAALDLTITDPVLDLDLR